MRLSDDDFIALVTSPNERRNLEFKPGGERRGYHLAQVARAVLGMANLRDGGVVILGVEETPPGTFERKGVNAADCATWANHDDVVSALTAHGDPAFSVERTFHDFEGMRFIVLQVREFDTVPIICKKGFKDATTQKQVLQAGLCYIRSAGKPESVPVPSLLEMRELFDLATEKGVRRFITQARNAGLSLSGGSIPTDTDHFAAEVAAVESEQDGHMFLAQIRGRGYWRVVIRPTTYDSQRIPQITALFPLIVDRSVRLRGWDFPQARAGSTPNFGLNSIGYTSSYHAYLEYWRFYQSGQFIDYMAMNDDWRVERGRRYISAEEDTGKYLPIDDTIKTFAEIFEFAARLALTDAYSFDSVVHIEVTLYGLKDRILYVDDPAKTRLYTLYKASLESFPHTVDVPRADLIADSRRFALEAATELFNRFGWQPGMVSLTPALDNLRY